MGLVLCVAALVIAFALVISWPFASWLQSSAGIAVLIVAGVTIYSCFKEGWRTK